MNKEEAEIVIKNTINYANQEIEKNKKKSRMWIVGTAIVCLMLLIAGTIFFLLKPNAENGTENTNVLKSYSQNADGSWTCENYSYKYKLEITGRMNGAAVTSTFVYLSNKMDITFEQAWKAAGFSSNMSDYFTTEEAILVEWRNE